MTTYANPQTRTAEPVKSDRAALLLRPREVAALLGISRTATYSLLADGAIPTVRIGRSVRVPTAAIDDYVERLLNEQTR